MKKKTKGLARDIYARLVTTSAESPVVLASISLSLAETFEEQASEGQEPPGVFVPNFEESRAPRGYVEVQACDTVKAFASDEEAGEWLCSTFGGTVQRTMSGSTEIISVSAATALKARLIGWREYQVLTQSQQQGN